MKIKFDKCKWNGSQMNKNDVFESKVGIVNRIHCILYAEKMYFAFYQSHVWRFSKNKKIKITCPKID